MHPQQQILLHPVTVLLHGLPYTLVKSTMKVLLLPKSAKSRDAIPIQCCILIFCENAFDHPVQNCMVDCSE